MVKRLVFTTIAGFVAALGATGILYAQNTQVNSDPIRSGLWTGANLEFDTNNQNNAATSNSARSTSTGGTRYPTPSTNTGGTRYPSQGNQTQSNGSTNGTYAALGDSVAAGLGLSGNQGGGQCGRTSQAYPYRVAQSTGLSLNHIACSGATVGDLVSRQGVSGPNIPAQLDTAFVSGTPRLITITAGANDVKWVDFLKICYTSTCANQLNTLAANGYMMVLRAKMEYVLRDIERRSNGNPPQVIVTGYYNPVSNACKNRIAQITPDEIDWLNTERSTLNRTIRDVVADHSFATYASTNFDGHGICSSDSWVQGLNDAAPLHPTAAGQAAIADSVLQTINR
jgi:lysophospholipase L1-like esterase